MNGKIYKQEISCENMFDLKSYKNSKLGFFISGLMNNYNFIVIFGCAYSLSQNKKFVNPALLILSEIIPGFITQLIYPQILYKIPYKYRIFSLFLIQILSSLFLMINPENLFFLFSGIILVSINSYLGESSMLSLSSLYEKKELQFWSIGTGLAGLVGTGLFLVLNLWMDMRLIFGLNLIIYLVGMSSGLYFIDVRNKIKQIEQLNELNQEQSKEDMSQKVSIDNFDLNNPNDNSDNIPTNPIHDSASIAKRHFKFFIEIYPIICAYFFAYLFAFGYVPSLVQNNLDYQITQFITRTFLFIGRTIGNYIHVNHLRLFGLIHLYNLFILFVFTIFNSLNLKLNFIWINLIFLPGYFINGVSYPMVYQFIYKTYTQDKEWYMGSVGQYTSFFTILGCAIGYPLQLVWSR